MPHTSASACVSEGEAAAVQWEPYVEQKTTVALEEKHFSIELLYT